MLIFIILAGKNHFTILYFKPVNSKFNILLHAHKNCIYKSPIILSRLAVPLSRLWLAKLNNVIGNSETHIYTILC